MLNSLLMASQRHTSLFCMHYTKTYKVLLPGENVPHIEQPLGDYPTIVTQENGRKVPVVQVCYLQTLIN